MNTSLASVITPLALSILIRSATAENPQFYQQVQADSYAEPVPIHAFIGAWHAPERPGHLAFMDAYSETGIHSGNNTLAYTLSDDYMLRFSPALASMYYAYKNTQPLASGAYPVALQVQQIATEGVRWGHRWSLQPSWSLTTGLNLLNGLSLINGQTNGMINYSGPHFNANNFPAANLNVDYAYSKPHLHESELDTQWYPNQPTGVGYALDFALHGQWSALLADLQVRNLAGKMHWSTVPQTSYSADCQCAQHLYNFSGSLQKASHYEQTLPWVAEGHLQWQVAPGAITLDSFSNHLQTLIRAGVAIPSGLPKLSLKLAIEPQSHSVDLECNSTNFSLRWQSDALNMNQSHRLGTALRFNIPI